MVVFFESKIEDLVRKGLLNEPEGETARYFLRRGRARREDPAGLERYLNVAWRALHDKSVHRERGIKTERDRDNLVASHARDAIVKTQLGYRMDNLGTDYPGGRFDTYEQLLEGIRRNRRLIKGGAYCAGGTLNAFIEALRDYHPDVILLTDQAARQRMARMARAQFLKNGLAAFLQQSYQERPYLFDDEASLREVTQAHLLVLVNVERDQPYSEFVRVDAEYEIMQHLELCFEDAVRQATPLKPIHDYLRGTSSTGLTNDLSVWAASQGHLSLSSVERAFTAQADDLIAEKLVLLTETPSAKAAAEIRAKSTGLAKAAAVHYRKKVYWGIALSVMERVPMVDHPKKARATLVDLVVAELKGQGTEDDTLKEIDGYILEDDIVREQLYAKVTD